MGQFDRNAWYVVVYGTPSKVFAGTMALDGTSIDDVKERFNRTTEAIAYVALDVIYCGQIEPVRIERDGTPRRIARVV